MTEINPHWLEPFVGALVAALLWFIRRDIGRIDKKLDRVDHHEAELQVQAQRITTSETEIGYLRSKLERHFGWTPKPRKAPSTP